MKPRRAFTLIELLVVVAIIGILASVVLASLSGARSQGNDTGVKAELGTIATQAVLYYGIGNTYGPTNTGSTACTTAGTVFNDSGTTIDKPIQNSIPVLQKDAGGTANVVCRSRDQQFIVMAKLSTGHWLCVDSSAGTTIGGAVDIGMASILGYVCQP